MDALAISARHVLSGCVARPLAVKPRGLVVAPDVDSRDGPDSAGNDLGEGDLPTSGSRIALGDGEGGEPRIPE